MIVLGLLSNHIKVQFLEIDMIELLFLFIFLAPKYLAEEEKPFDEARI